MLNVKIMHACVHALTVKDDDEDVVEPYIEACCKLLSTIGKVVDNTSSGKSQMDKHMITLSNMLGEKLSSRTRFVIEQLVEQRRNPVVVDLDPGVEGQPFGLIDSVSYHGAAHRVDPEPAQIELAFLWFDQAVDQFDLQGNVPYFLAPQADDGLF